MPRITRPQSLPPCRRGCTGWCGRCCPGNGSGRRSCCCGWRIRSYATSGRAAPTRDAAPPAVKAGWSHHLKPVVVVLGVVGQLYRLGDSDPVVQSLIDAYPDPGQTVHSGFTLNAAQFVPVDNGYYHYQGSLTTPPCTEDVDWYVLRDARTISQEQVNRIAALHNGFNHRPIQARNRRGVIYTGPR